MAKAISLEKGSFMSYKDRPHMVIEKEIHAPGKGVAIIRLKIRDLQSGAVSRLTLKTQEEVEEIEVSQREYEFLYRHRDTCCFVEPETKKRIEVKTEMLGDDVDFLKQGESYRIYFYEEEPVTVRVPPKVTLEVTEAEAAARGNTASAATKEVAVETGLKVRVPLFVVKGDKILVNTESREYAGRV